MTIIENYINGKKTSKSKDLLDVFDPSTGEVISKVILSDINDFNQVLKSSLASQKIWSETTPLKRSRIMSNYKNLIEKNIST